MEFVLEQMAGAGPVRARRMFGGHGIFAGDLAGCRKTLKYAACQGATEVAPKSEPPKREGFARLAQGLPTPADAENVREGLFSKPLMFALVYDDRLYFKTDGQNLVDFESRGLAPFTYETAGRTVAMSYSEAPEEVFDDPDAMAEWAGKAIAAARRAASKKLSRRKG